MATVSPQLWGIALDVFILSLVSTHVPFAWDTEEGWLAQAICIFVFGSPKPAV